MAIVQNPVLSYVAQSLMTSSPEYVKKVVLDFYTPEEIITARDDLKANVDSDIVSGLIKRRNVTSDKGSALTVSDIIDAMKSLDDADCMPNFVLPFKQIHRLPLAAPCETSSVSIVDRLSKLEARVALTESMLGSSPPYVTSTWRATDICYSFSRCPVSAS